jgi:signal transduction histidine kinase
LSPALALSRDILDRQLAHLTRLIDDLLDAGRLTSGKIHIRPRRIDFKRVVAHAVETVSPVMSAKSQVLDIKLPSGDITVNADEVRLVQVLQNLLSNASKFTTQGGRIELTANVLNARLFVAVADNGRGMDPAALDKVFELFTQGPDNKETFNVGLGIGLALARSIVEMHGGRISASSGGVGEGSTFSFELPGATLEERPGSLTS